VLIVVTGVNLKTHLLTEDKPLEIGPCVRAVFEADWAGSVSAHCRKSFVICSGGLLCSSFWRDLADIR